MTLSLSVEDDRLGAYYRKTIAIADRLDKSLDYDQVMEALQRIHDGNVADLPQTKMTKQKPAVLAPCADVAVPALTEAFVPREYFKTRTGLYLWNDMNRVLADTKPVESADGVALKSFDLTRNAHDRDIKAELPAQHEVELWHIAKLIDAQKNGEAGPLLTNGYANIFYVSGFAVYVYWGAGYRGWHVRGWLLDDGHWRRDRRVFSRN